MKRIYQRPGIVLVNLCFIVFLAAIPWQVVAQGTIQVTDQAWEANFRDHLTFTMSAQSTAEIAEVELFYRVVGQPATSRNEVDFTPGTSIDVQFVINQFDTTDPNYNYFPPGTELEYWWKIIDADGNELKTEKEKLILLDNRYDWQTLQNERLTLYWNKGDDDFGQALFDRANLALDTLESDMGITLEEPIKIFIYPSHSDLMSALSVVSQDWTGGAAFTEYGIVVIGINLSQLSWGLNAMTHEMTHLVIHQATDNPYSGLPKWLDEGIAVYNENPDELVEDFRFVFERAVKDEALISLRTLSSPFPADFEEANLSYGQSGTVVKFIIDTYGSEKMAELLSVFAEGAIPDEALEQVLSVDTDGLDSQFRVSLGLSPLPGAEVAGEEPVAAEPDEGSEATEEDQVVEPEPTSESGDTSSTESEDVAQPSPETPESTGNPLSCLPCVSGILALLVMSAGLYTWRK